MNIKHRGYLYALAAVIIWSGFILISRLGGISDLGVFDVIAIRYLTCSLILLPAWWLKFRFNLIDHKLIICSLIGGLAYALCTFHGFEMVPASHAAILLPGLMPLFIVICSYFMNKEKHSGEKWLGILIITLGIFVLLWPMVNNQGFSTGYFLLICGALCWAIFSVLIKRWEIGPWHATASLAIITCAIYMPIYLIMLPKKISIVLLPDIALQAFYQGFMATIVQMIFYVRAVQTIGPSSMGAMMAIVPLLSGVSAIIIFKETVTWGLIFGMILVSIGALLAHKKWFNKFNTNCNFTSN